MCLAMTEKLSENECCSNEDFAQLTLVNTDWLQSSSINEMISDVLIRVWNS